MPDVNYLLKFEAWFTRMNEGSITNKSPFNTRYKFTQNDTDDDDYDDDGNDTVDDDHDYYDYLGRWGNNDHEAD